MSTVFDADRLLALSPAPGEAARWTAVVPAAGRGSRLGADAPKVLYPILGRPILDWLVDLVAPFCARVVVVASDEGKDLIETRLEALLGQRGAVVVQPKPVGMADAVARGMKDVSTDNTLVLWGDQITPRAETLARCIRLHLESGAKLTMPTVLRADPYIHFERHPDGRLKRVYERREADQPLKKGESDAGLFLFRTDALRALLSDGLGRPEAIGRKTGEASLLALLPAIDRVPGDVLSVRIADVDEALGVNTPEEALKVEAVLSARKGMR